MIEKFDGKAIIKVRFRNKLEYEKFRKYILKTSWNYGDAAYPLWEEMPLAFHCIDDLNRINNLIIYLLQLKFEVYCCKYQMDVIMEEESDEKVEEEEEIDLEKEFGDIWRKAMQT